MRELSFATLIFPVIALLCSPAVSSAATYYVSTSGSDSASGTSIAAAWRTIQKAANTVVAGDVVRVQVGTYNERITETTDGSSAQPITYLADGAVVIFGGVWLDGSDYVRFIGFEITQNNAPSAFNYEMFRIDNARGVEVIDCNLHHADRECLTFRGSNDLIVRGNNISYSGWRTFPWTVPGTGNALVWGGSAISINVLAEYNTLSQCDDFFNANYAGNSDWVIRNNRFGPEDPRTGSHLDNLQPNGALSNYLMEANWDEGNDIGLLNPDGGHHMQHLETAGTRNIVRGNVTLSSAGSLGWTNGDNNYAYHNTWHGTGSYSGNYTVIRAYNVYGSSLGNAIFNNIFSLATSGNNPPLSVEPPSTAAADYNLAYQSGSFSQGSHNVTADPQFVNIPGKDFSIQGSSPARSTGGPLALASSAGTNSTLLQVDTAGLFWVGDEITIGSGAAVNITALSTSANTLTLSAPRSWSAGNAVRWRGQTDIGALPYRAAGYSYDISIASPGTSAVPGVIEISANVTNPGVVRMVEFRIDGVPLAFDSSAPFSATWNAGELIGSHQIIARAYALYASPTLWKQAQISVILSGSSQPPAAPQNLQVSQ